MTRALLSAAAGLLLSCAPEARQPVELYVAKGDLDAVRERGALRVLVPTLSEERLSRQGPVDAEDREMARLFAERIGVRAEFIEVDNRKDLVTWIEGGYGDVAMAQLTVTSSREKRVRFTRPTATVDEWIVGRKGDPDLPRNVAALDGREVHVRRSSAFAETLRSIAEEERISLRIVFVDEGVDTETIAYEVSRGKRPLTVVDSNLLSSIETYNDALERLFVVARGRELAWMVRREAEDLGAHLDAFIIEKLLTSHRSEDVTTGGLEAIRARGSLRVITLNDPVHYFLYRGRQMGFDYELGNLAARKLGVRLEMVVPPKRDLVFDWLLEGRGDVIATTLIVTPEREKVVAFSRPYLFVEEIVVQATSAPEKVSSVESLADKTIYVWRSSSYDETLRRLAEIVPFRIEPVPGEVELEQILDRVASGDYPLAVTDSLVLAAELNHRSDVEVAFSLAEGLGETGAREKPVAFAVRLNNPDLKEFLDEFVSELVGSLELNDARRRYFLENHGLRRVNERRAGVSGRLSHYDEIFKKYSKRYGLDWRLMVAQAYQESRLDPEAESWAGAKGLFQLLPATGLELGFEKLTDPEVSVHAGIKHMHLLLERLEPDIPLHHRLRFALAAYNAGWGHLTDARRLASEQGFDPNRWFGHTEKAMLMLSEPRYYRRARHGYVRGRETVDYVSAIQNRYDHYVTLVPF